MAKPSITAGLLSIIILIAPSCGYTTESFRTSSGHCRDMCSSHINDKGKSGWTCSYYRPLYYVNDFVNVQTGCDCGGCRRDCSLAEIKVHPSACAEAQKDIPGARDSTVAQVADAAADALIAAATVDDPFIGVGLSFVKQMLHTFGDDDPLEAMRKDINERFDAMLDCFGEELAKSKAQDHINAMNEALFYYGNAERTSNFKYYEKGAEEKRAWLKFGAVISSEFKDYETDPAFYKALLMSTQNFAALYSILSVDWLGYLKNPIHANKNGVCAADVDYEMQVRVALKNLKNLIDWTKRAKEVISKGFAEEASKWPCRNGGAITAELKEWEDTFYAGQTAPIEKLYDALYPMSCIRDGDLCAKTKAYCASCGGFDPFAELHYDFTDTDTDTLELEGDSYDCKPLAVLSKHNYACRESTTVGNSFANVFECAAAAIHHDECGTSGEIMWAEGMSKFWGCACCHLMGQFSYEDNKWWAIYKYSADGVELPSFAVLDFAETDALNAEGDICAYDAIASDDAVQIEVLKVEDKYFFFDPTQLDEDVARKGEVMMVRNDRIGTVSVMVWKDGHGRMHPRKSAESGDWMVGDVLTVVGDDCADGLRCLPKNERDDTGSSMSMICQPTGGKDGRARLLGA